MSSSNIPPIARQRFAKVRRYVVTVARPRHPPSIEDEPMAGKKVSCDCGKVIRAENDGQLIADVQKHAKDVHNMSLTPDQILSMAEPTQ
jgi:predicted small metal-binding protein